MSAVIAEVDQPELVCAIEWPTADIAPEYLRVEHHAALIDAARREAEKLGLRPSTGATITRIVRRGEPDEAIRIIFGIDRG